MLPPASRPLLRDVRPSFNFCFRFSSSLTRAYPPRSKPDCKRCRNAGRECVWPSAENPSSTRKLPGGEVTLPSGTVVGARKKGSIAGSVGGGSKRSERGAGSAANEKKAETKRTSVAAAAAAFAAADIQEHEQLPERTQSASPPTSSSASPVPAGFKQQLAQQPAKHKQHRSPSSVCSSALSPCPSASDGESTTPPPPGASLVDSAVAATIERAQSMEIDGSVSPMSNVLPQMPPSFSGSAVGGTDQWLLPWFPTAEARGLILHFCQNSGALLSASCPPPANLVLARADRDLFPLLSGQPAHRLTFAGHAASALTLAPARFECGRRRPPDDAPDNCGDPSGLSARQGPCAAGHCWSRARPRRRLPGRGTRPPCRCRRC